MSRITTPASQIPDDAIGILVTVYDEIQAVEGLDEHADKAIGAFLDSFDRLLDIEDDDPDFTLALREIVAMLPEVYRLASRELRNAFASTLKSGRYDDWSSGDWANRNQMATTCNRLADCAASLLWGEIDRMDAYFQASGPLWTGAISP